MNPNRIDKIGVAAAVDYFCRMGYIDPHINFDDKIPFATFLITFDKVIGSISFKQYPLAPEPKEATTSSSLS